ncbi:MAG: hypothetical protein K2L87_07545, partial [Clostridiales bacterium]|nr:hypothetical protein [Clostridiales bacterium]
VVTDGQVNAGTGYKARATALSNPNYSLGSVNVVSPEFKINKADIAIKFAVENVTIGIPVKLEVTGSFESTDITYKVLSDISVGDGEVKGDIFNPTKLGEVFIQVHVGATQNYNEGTVTCKLIVEKPEAPVQLITKEVIYGNETVLELRGHAGGEFTFELAEEADREYGTIINTALIPRKVGQVGIRITVEETENYKKTTVVQYVTILPAPVVIVWDATRTFTYNGEEQAPKATMNPDYLYNNDDPFEIYVQGAVNAGSHTAVAIGTENTNYTVVGVEDEASLSVPFTITPRVVQLDWSDLERTYNGEEQYPTATVKDTILVEGDECIVTVTGATNVGTVSSTVVSLSNSNYTLTGASADNLKADFKITPAEVEIEWSNL